MGTITYQVKIDAIPEGMSLEQLSGEVDNALKQINDRMSTYQPDSELSRFNDSTDVGEWFEVSADTLKVAKTALRASEETGGAFDVTVGPLLKLWNFGTDRGEFSIPDQTAIDAAKGNTGFQHIKVRDDPPALMKSKAEIRINLSAIAKGYAVDVVARLLEEQSVNAYLVEIGGEMRSRGKKPDGEPWIIGIEKPLDDARAILKAVPLDGQAIATSGDYRNFYLHEGVRYSHTIDPRNGRPIEHGVASVSVITDQCMLADAWATSLMVLGPEAGYTWALDRNLAVLMILRGEHGWIEKATPRFLELAEVADPATGNNIAGTADEVTPDEPSPATATYLPVFVIFLAAIALMAVGVIVSNRRIKGSCGGLSGMKDASGNSICDACTVPSDQCSGVPQEDVTDTSG
ncbi:MAG: hypothetical protein CMJ78_10895 [Planctomycetaceae bacterium]|nr:hypothetical protein [Planctomycetaceae bacterium]